MIELVTAAAAAVPLAAGWSWHALQLRRRITDARRDPLTGLATRAEFEERAAASLLQGPRVVMVLDLDGFKQINDALGHAAGDEVIRIVGRRLAAWADQHGGIVARLGGDEFAAVLPVLSYADLDWTMDGLGEQLTVPAVFEDCEVPVGFSAGVVWSHPRQVPNPGLAGWLRRADEAMYLAKRSGGGWHLAVGPNPALPTVNGRRKGRRGSSGVAA
ncbi:GGDEF domain-containing protein [Streptomyces sp. NPDC020799]|uniref:GGDEF domain-containing protein n=1 Tax=Streptomyces sp. NPDC020799 TaxID=3365091 RepID=UPI0037BD65B6